MNNSIPSWEILPNSCTCYLPLHKSLLYHSTDTQIITELLWTKVAPEVSMQPYCPYHSVGGGGGGAVDTLFQSGYSDPISGTLQSIVNQATMTFEDHVIPCSSYFESFSGLDDVQPLTAKNMVTGDDWIDNLRVMDSPEKEMFSSGENYIVIPDDDDEEEIIQGLKDEAKKNNKNKMKMKAPTKMNPRTSVYHDQFETRQRKRDKVDERMAHDNQKNKELDGVVDHLKIMQTQMNGTNTPLPLPPPPATARVRPVPIIPKMTNHFYRFLCTQSWPMTDKKYIQMVDFYFRNQSTH